MHDLDVIYPRPHTLHSQRLVTWEFPLDFGQDLGFKPPGLIKYPI